MRDFTVQGYLIGIDGNRLVLKVDDDDVARISAIKTLHARHHQPGNFIAINFKCKAARWEIANLNWSDPKDLIGTHLRIECTVIICGVQRRVTAPVGADLTNRVSRVYTNTPSFRARVIKNIQ